MAQQIKYTTDGKKVIVVGKLNSQETIVQEIFIVNGNEIPSGENFVTKSLHDAPAVSWKESELKKLEQRFDKEQKEWKTKIDSLYHKKSALSKELSEKVAWAARTIKTVNEDDFDFIVKFISGGFQWVVLSKEYGSPEIHSWEEYTSLDSYSDLRLLSIHGRPDKTLTSYRGAYSDYSGGQTRFLPFADYDSAFECFKDAVLAKGVNDDIIAIAKKYNIQLDPAKVEIYRINVINSCNLTIESATKTIRQAEARIEAINNI